MEEELYLDISADDAYAYGQIIKMGNRRPDAPADLNKEPPPVTPSSPLAPLSIPLPYLSICPPGVLRASSNSSPSLQSSLE